MYDGGFPRASQQVQIARGQYDHARDGTLDPGDHDLTAQKLIPANAIILGGFINVATALDGETGATVAVKVEGSADIQAAAGFGSAPWSTTGLKSTVPNFTGAEAILTTEPRAIVATVATEAITAGKFDVVLFYTVLDD